MKSIKSNMSHDFDIKSALRKRGYVTGEGGIDKIPAKLTKGEAVLPRETVEALGGPEGVDELILRTTGKRSAPKMEDGELHAAEGWVGDSVDWLRNKVGSAAEAVGRMTSPKGVEQTARAAGEAVKAGIDFGSGVKANYTAGYEAGPQAPKGPPEGIDKNFFKNRQSIEQILRGSATPNPTIAQQAEAMVGKGVDAVKSAVTPTKTPWYKPSGLGFKGIGVAARGAAPLTAAAGMVGGVGEAMNTDIDKYGESLGVDMKDAGALKKGALYGLRFLQGTGNTIAGMVGAGDLDKNRAMYDTRAPARQPGPNPNTSPLDDKGGPGDGGPGDFAKATEPLRSPVAAAPGLSDEERQAMQNVVARQNGENRMQAYARESALRKQMVEDNLDREYNPGTGLAEVMPPTDMFGQTAAQRQADMDRFSARVALGRIGQGAGKQYAASQLAAAQGYNQLADDAIAAEQKGIDTKKEMVGGHLTRQAALRGKGMDVAAERQKSLDAREGARYRDDRGLEGDKYKADAAVEAARLGLQGDLARAYATKRAGEMKAKGDRETAGVKALTDRLVSMYGDPTKDPEAQKKINDRMNLLTGTMAKHGYSADLLNDPRILERLLVTTERQAGVRDSEKGIVAALKGLVNPNRRPALDSDIGTDYNPLAVGRQGMFGRDVRTAAGDTSQSAHEYGPDAGVLDQLTRSRLRRKQWLDQVQSFPTYDE